MQQSSISPKQSRLVEVADGRPEGLTVECASEWADATASAARATAVSKPKNLPRDATRKS